MKKLRTLFFLLLFSLTGLFAKEEIEYALWDSDLAPAFRELARVYMEKNPNVKVNIVITPWTQYWTKLEAGITGDIAPDIFWMNAPHLIKYAMNGVLEPATDIFTADMKKNIAKPAIDIYEFQGKLWAVPIIYDSIGIVYNKRIFDKYGVPYPKEGWNWKEFTGTLKKLESKLPKDIYPMALGFEDQTTLYPYVSSAGGYIISKNKKKSGYNDKNTINAVDKIASLYKKGYVAPFDVITEAPLMTTRLFYSEKAAMAQLGVWTTNRVDNLKFAKDVGVTTIPVIKKKGNVTHVVGVSVFKKSKKKKIAKDFLKFSGSQTAYKIYAEYKIGLVPDTRFNSIYKAAFKNIDINPYVNAIQYASLYPYSYDTGKWQEYQNRILKDVFTGKTSAKSGARKIYKRMNRILKREKY